MPSVEWPADLSLTSVAIARNGAQECAWDHTAQVCSLFDAQPGTFYLVRPDGHVLGRWRQVRAGQVAAALAAAGIAQSKDKETI